MTPLREKVIKVSELRNLAKNTQRGYLTDVRKLARHYHQFPDKLTKNEIEDYLLYLKNDKGRSADPIL
jgi:integrase/recombinase XerD